MQEPSREQSAPQSDKSKAPASSSERGKAASKKPSAKRSRKLPLRAVHPDGTPAAPNEVLDSTDPGDDSQFRCRYQHGYGVILLIAAAAAKLNYVSLWCEHHDDLLGQRHDGLYESYQVKTAKPEIGPWDLGREGILSAFKKFVRLDHTFPKKMALFAFVSNADCLDSDAASKVKRSPVRLCKAVGECKDLPALPTPFVEVIATLANHCECTAESMFRVMKRTKLIKGPPLDGFESSIAHEHLPMISECQGLSPMQLNSLRDELIYRVYDASSLKIDDPAKHWYCVTATNGASPRLMAKRIDVATIRELIDQRRLTTFRFSPSSSALRLQDDRAELSLLHKKLLKGGLASQLDTMQQRTLSAERHLLGLAASKPDDIADILNQLKSVVKGICDDAHLATSAPHTVYGPKMMTEVLTHLRQKAQASPDTVCRQEYECLAGVAGLLTEACEVWWSPQFDVERAV